MSGPAPQPQTADAPQEAPPVRVELAPSDRVVGLYSYPKSGNTWLRAILAGICGIPTTGGMFQRYLTDSHFGQIIQQPWPFEGRDWYFYKSHRKEVLSEHQGQIFDTHQVLYIYRHPLDVFMSYLNFVSKNVSPNAGKSLPVQFDRVEDLGAEDFETLFAIFLEHATLFPQNKAFGSVFEHAAAFRARQAAGNEVLILRYEDLTDHFAREVGRITDFLGLDAVDPARVYDIADRRTQKNGKFFWKRQKGNYRNWLSDDQIARFQAQWGEEMRALGYDG